MHNQTCSLASVSCRRSVDRASWLSPLNGGGVGALIELRREAGDKFEETRGLAAERAVAPLEIEEEVE